MCYNNVTIIIFGFWVSLLPLPSSGVPTMAYHLNAKHSVYMSSRVNNHKLTKLHLCGMTAAQ